MSAKRSEKFPVSIASYSFHGLQESGQLDVFGYLQVIKYRYNVDYADIWSGYLPNLDREFLLKIRRTMDENDVTLANLCVDGPHLWDDNADVRAEHKQNALKYIEAAKVLGARTIRIDMGSMEEVIPDDKFDYIASTYREYAELCAPEGMRIGTENHWGSSRFPHNLERLYTAVNHKNYGHLFHFGNFPDGQIELGLETVLKMAMHTHVSAESIPNAKEWIRQLAQHGYAGTYSIEHHSAKHEYERVAWQVATVRDLIAELEEEGIEKPAETDFFKGIYSGK